MKNGLDFYIFTLCQKVSIGGDSCQIRIGGIIWCWSIIQIFSLPLNGFEPSWTSLGSHYSEEFDAGIDIRWGALLTKIFGKY